MVWKQWLTFGSGDIMEGRCACFVAAAGGGGGPAVGTTMYGGPHQGHGGFSAGLRDGVFSDCLKKQS